MSRPVADWVPGAPAELGWVLDPAHSGRGYATEAVRELLRFCFGDLGVRRVVAGCFLDTVGYALLADEWRQGQARQARR